MRGAPSREIDIDVALGADDAPTDPELALALPGPSAPSEQVVDGDRSDWVPLEWALRRVRTHSLLSGLAGGAVVAIAFLAWQSHATRGPPPLAAAAAAAPVPEAQIEAAPLVERATTARMPAPRRSAAAAPRAAAGGQPARPGGSTVSGWVQVDDSADAEEATPGSGASGDAGTTLAGPLDGGSAASSETAPAEETARADPQGAAEPEPAGVPTEELTAGAESAAPPAEPGASPSDPGPAATGRAPDVNEVAAALRGRRGELEACIAEANAAGGAAREGPRRLSFVVVVDPSGRVSNALLDDEPGDSTPLGACLLRIARALSFSPFEGDPAQVRLALNRVSR